MNSDYRNPPSLRLRNCRTATRDFLKGQALNSPYPIAITLTIKQRQGIRTKYGIHLTKTSPIDAIKTASQFSYKLNRLVYGNAARRYGKALRQIVVLQGLKTDKHLHLHMAVGGLPDHIELTQFPRLVEKAKRLTPLLDKQYKVDHADTGWIDYICAELGRQDTDTILWDICKF